MTSEKSHSNINYSPGNGAFMERKRMKLRNKKTGELGQIGYVATSGGEIIVEDISGDEYPYSVISSYKTLAELNEEWEDYQAEPLIKDEKIRKAVRVWADVNGCDKLWVKLWEYCGHGAISFYDEDAGDNEITFNTVKKFGLEHLKSYTITELCGSEE